MGPLTGIRVLEIAALGPAPFCAMLFADLGADVLRVDRSGTSHLRMPDPRRDLLNRGKRSVAIDLKHPRGIETVLRLCERSAVLIEGFRPGVMERLGLSPASCQARNPKLVYARMTGFGQDGPLAKVAGHDINYVALSGALHSIGSRGEPPAVPINFVGDFGGGGMMLAFGIACALLEAQRSGRGQIIDASMVEGAALLTTMVHGLMANGLWRDERGTNLLDGAAPFYSTYETRDAKWISLGPIEPQFYAEFLRRAGLDPNEYAPQLDPADWPRLKAKLVEVFKEKTRDEWTALLEGTEACYAPVLSLGEAAAHPHNRARGSFVERDGITQPGPSPRFSRTGTELRSPPPLPGEQTESALLDWGFAAAEVAALLEEKAVGRLQDSTGDSSA